MNIVKYNFLLSAELDICAPGAAEAAKALEEDIGAPGAAEAVEALSATAVEVAQ